MPCYDPRNDEPKIEYRSGISPEELAAVKNENAWLLGALCAVINELERKGIAPVVLAEASRNGLVGVLEFWAKHKNDDASRLAKELHRYSKDEQRILKELLDNLSI